jgi:hypothetical protein
MVDSSPQRPAGSTEDTELHRGMMVFVLIIRDSRDRSLRANRQLCKEITGLPGGRQACVLLYASGVVYICGDFLRFVMTH